MIYLSYYKNDIARVICENKEIVALLSNDVSSEGSSLLYKNIKPFLFAVDQTIEDEICILCFDIEEKVSQKNNILSSLILTIEVFCHDRISRTEQGLRTDLLSDAIKLLFHNEEIFTAWKVHFLSSSPLRVSSKFHGRRLVFEVLDDNREGCD